LGGESLRGSVFEPRGDSLFTEHQRAGRYAVVLCCAEGALSPFATAITLLHTDMKSTGLDVSGLKVGAIINTSSGGRDSDSETEMLDILKSAGVTNCKGT